MKIHFKDQGLRKAFKSIENNAKIDIAAVNKLLKAADDGPGLSKTEAQDLQRWLQNSGDRMEPEAQKHLNHFLTTTGVATAGHVPLVRVSEDVSKVLHASQLSEAFSREMNRRIDLKPDAAFQVFAEYGGRLKALLKSVPTKEHDRYVEALLEAGAQSQAAGYAQTDMDFDTVNDLREAALARNSSAFDVRDEEVGKVWTTTYWPMAGKEGGLDQPGDGGIHLWAKEGALSKLDQLLRSRGHEDTAKALEFERKPALSWLIGEKEKGHYIPSKKLSETDAEWTTGVDFDGDGKITKDVKADFLGHDGGFATLASRNNLIPKATIDGEVVNVTKERIDGSDGDVRFVFKKADGTKLSADEIKSVFYANPNSDGKVDKNMDVGWWGSCDKVALAGVLFKEPMKEEVTIDGVTFTKQDVLGLLTVIADSQADGTDFVGHRYDEKSDIVVTHDGRQLHGKFKYIKESDFRDDKDMWRWDGDYMVMNNPFSDRPDMEVVFKELDGTEHTLKASDIKHMAREDKKDIAPIAFHTTMLKWLGEGRAAAMDRDSGDHVWNYSFHGATLKSGVELTGDARNVEAGHNGPVGENTKLVQYEMDVRFGESDWPRSYKYWLEFDASGKAINGGWLSDNPDFLWRPAKFKNWQGENARNPYVQPELIKEIYDRFMES